MLAAVFCRVLLGRWCCLAVCGVGGAAVCFRSCGCVGALVVGCGLVSDREAWGCSLLVGFGFSLGAVVVFSCVGVFCELFGCDLTLCCVG